MKNTILLLLLAGVAGLTATLALSSGELAPAPAERRPDQAVELEAIRKGIDDVVALLSRMERSAEEQAVALPHECEGTGVTSALRELCERLDRQPLGASPGRIVASAPSQSRLPRHTSTVWHALDQLVDLWGFDPEQARLDVLFLEPDELLARFGPPQRVHADDDGEIRWSYGATRPDGGQREYQVLVSMHGGYVTRLRVIPG